MTTEGITRVTLGEILSANKQPLLPFEDKVLRDRLEELGVQQDKIGKEHGEAMHQSSETWHDNPAAEVLAAQSVGLTTEARSIMRALNLAEVVQYGSVTPERPDAATLGSLVEVQFGKNDVVPMLVTGYCGKLDDELLEALGADAEAVTINSPLGAALLERVAGEQIAYSVGERALTATLQSVEVFRGPA